MKRHATMKRHAFSLVEILVCILLLALAVIPVVELLTTSKKMSASARDRTLAMNLASSYLSTVSNLPRKDLPELAPTVDANVTGVCSLSQLGLAPTPDGYIRKLALVKLEPGRMLFHAVVIVEWTSPISRRSLSYKIDRLLE